MVVRRENELLVEWVPIDSLKPYPGNAQIHSNHQVRQIANSMDVFGFTNPVLISKTNQTIAGEGRVKAGKLRGMSHVPAIRLENLTEDQIKAYVIADNKIGRNAGLDKSILAIELQHLLKIDTDFDITVTGFEIPEIDLLLSTDPSPSDEIVEAPSESEPITQPGDIWTLGRHKILCGSAIDQNTYSRLLGKKRAGVVFVDPPYNMRIRGNVSGNGAIRHREFLMGSGEMTELEFGSFLESSFKLLAQYSASGSVHFVCSDWRRVREMLTAGKPVYDSVLNICVWVKNVGAWAPSIVRCMNS
jgi:hypothetical protein